MIAMVIIAGNVFFFFFKDTFKNIVSSEKHRVSLGLTFVLPKKEGRAHHLSASACCTVRFSKSVVRNNQAHVGRSW